MTVGSTVIPLLRAVIYTTIGAFPTSGLQIGDLGWATDREFLLRWSGTVWQSIGISSRHGLKSAIGTASDYPESSLYQADDEGLLYMVVSAAWQQVVFMPSLPLWYVGDLVVLQAGTERGTTSNIYVKAKEIRIASGGTIRVSFDLKIGTTGENAYGKIFKNGADFGTQRITGSTTYETYTEDLAFANGDLVQLYHRSANVTHTCYVRNFRLKADRYHIHEVLTD